MNSPQRKSEGSFESIVDAWTLLKLKAGIRIIKSEREFREMNALADYLIDKIGSNEKHPLSELLELVGTLIQRYEDENIQVPNAEPREVLKFLMKINELKQVDLKAEIGSQGIVSEILSGKRSINSRQAKALAARFAVSPAVFI